MNIVQINSVNFGSTGNITLKIADAARKEGHTVYTACPRSRDNQKKTVENQIFIGNRFSRNLHRILARITGLYGCFSYFSTLRFLRRIKRLKIDIIHLHNLHAYYINLPLLFRFIKKNNIKTIWTLHDCWAFTGQCPYFTYAKCDKWENGCYACSQYKRYPESYVDRTRLMYKKKKRWFTGVKDMTIVTPSLWLKELAKRSFLKEYPVTVINNGIDLNVFKPSESDFREKNGIGKDKKILLGVAFDWEARKGLDVFTKLEGRLDPDKYKIVLVGTNDETDKTLPKSIISVHRTPNQTELAKIYTAADLFINPTREENYPTVNMEALACGTPVLTFNTGGSAEIPDKKCGAYVPTDDVDALEKMILSICASSPFSTEACLERAKNFDHTEKFGDYIKLYEKI